CTHYQLIPPTAPGSIGQLLSISSISGDKMQLGFSTITGTGTLTSVATTAPISGGTITTSGTISCPTCATTTSGGPLSATSPVTISSGGIIAITGITGKKGNVSLLQPSTGSTILNDLVCYDANSNAVDCGVQKSSLMTTDISGN